MVVGEISMQHKKTWTLTFIEWDERDGYRKGAIGDGTTAGEGQQKQHHQRGVAYTLLTEKDASFCRLACGCIR
jgi:hypothetical protein